ncbi:MAG: sialidase family protein [Oscillospiraceae bacterium]|nr:sialidase family protein [Oscillospiraceae bacterium]
MKQTRWMMLGAVAAAAMFTTGCAGVGLLLARQTAQLQNTPTEPEPVAPAVQTAEAQPEPTLPVAIWDPQALQLSSQNGLYVLGNPFDGQGQLPLPPEVEQAADTLALADLNVYQDTLILVLLQPNSDHPNNVAKATLYRSDDLGAHWREQKMSLPVLGLQEEEQLADAFLNFWSEQCGSLILETDRACRSVLLTSDGGLTWNKLEDLTGEDGDAWMCGGGFVSEQLGFLATTDQHQLEPRLYQTRDGGTTWEKMPMKLPTLTGLLRAEALTPQRVEDGAIVIPVRVYQQRSGGQWVHILQYISRDEGMTWKFAQQEG